MARLKPQNVLKEKVTGVTMTMAVLRMAH